MTPIIQRDSVWLGIALGLLVPAIAYAVLLTLYTLLDTMGIFSDFGFADDFRIRTLALFAICSNLIMVNRYHKSYKNETIRGIMVASMILVAIWFFVFGLKIMND